MYDRNSHTVRQLSVFCLCFLNCPHAWRTCIFFLKKLPTYVSIERETDVDAKNDWINELFSLEHQLLTVEYDINVSRCVLQTIIIHFTSFEMRYQGTVFFANGSWFVGVLSMYFHFQWLHVIVNINEVKPAQDATTCSSSHYYTSFNCIKLCTKINLIIVR